ncbi:MAG: hypothetical protein Q4G68_09905 [Planctomycetia bacterium]|nr:hypothetical protein [Planctomycetia bacterium]
MNNSQGGLRIHASRGNKKVKPFLFKFVKWLRKEYSFPHRVNVYLSPNPYIISRLTGERCVSTTWIPGDLELHDPYIRLATGNYPILLKKVDKNSARANILHALASALTSYWQWIETGDMDEKGMSRKATAILRKYERVVKYF